LAPEEKMNTRTAIGILAVFTMTLSMAVLLPARADSIPPPGTSVETQFAVSGPAADQIQYQIFADETGEFNALAAQQIDIGSTPMNKAQLNSPTFCPTGTAFWCTGVAPNPPDGEFGFQHDDINLANNFWGVTFCFAQDGITAGGACQPHTRTGAVVTVPGYPFTTATCANVPAPHAGDCTYAGIQWRQGFASLLDKGCKNTQPLCATSHGLVNTIFGGAAQSIDNIGDVPAQSIQHSGYSFDSSCAPSLGPCVGPYQTPATGTAVYHLNGVCSWDSLHVTAGATNCVSANNFDTAGQGTSSSLDGITWNPGTVNFCNAADHFIAAGIGLGKNADCSLATLLGPGGDVVFAIRLDSPNRLASGTAEFKRFCSLLGAPISGTSCSRLTSTGGTLRLVNHQLTIGDAFTFVFSGSSTNGITTNTPNLDWNLYTGANSGGPAFNQQWALYDSTFVSTICGGTSAVPASPTGNFPLPNDVYSCNAKLDHYQEMTENNATIAGAAQSDQVAMELFGNHTINNPTISRTQQFAFLKGWQGVSDATGIGIATGNAFSLGNMWNPNPAISGPTIRWGMKQGTSSLNPFEFTTVFEFNILQEIYDALLTFTPYIPSTGPQIVGYMANTYSLVSHAGAVGTTDANCPTSAGFPAAGTGLKTDPHIKYVDLNNNNVWNLGEPVIYDTNNNNVFDAGDIVISGATPVVGTALKTDPLLKYNDAFGNNVWTSSPGFTDQVIYDAINNNVYDLGEQLAGGGFPVQGCVKLNLRGDQFWQDGQQVTASDVKFSYEGFNATGGIASGGTVNTVDVIYDPAVLPTSLGGGEAPGQPENFYIALASANAFALLDIVGVPIVPQHIWHCQTMVATSSNPGLVPVGTCAPTPVPPGVTITTAPVTGACKDTAITNPGSGKGSAQCTIEPTYLSGPGADPVANNRLIGSSAYVCGVRNNAADPTSGFAVLGGGCTNTGTSTVTTGAITLYRYGTGVSHLSGSYFRNNAKYKEFTWAHTSSGTTANILDVSAISGCFANPAGALCPHYRGPDATITATAAGPNIGAVSGGTGGALTGLQKAEVVQWFGTAWTDPIAYSSLLGVTPAPAVIYEDGSQYS
jgi:hypothetical protein